MKHAPVFLIVSCLLCGLFPAIGSAQLFGQRELGGSVNRRPSPSLSNRNSASSANRAQSNRSSDGGNMNTVAGAERPALEAIGTMVSEEARFVRGNRESTDFVGTDAGEAEGFVGAQQAGVADLIESGIDESLQVEMIEDMNRLAEPVVPPRLLLNPPRLQLGFQPPSTTSPRLAAVVQDRLMSSLTENLASGIAVSAEAGVVTLRGVVPSERERKLAALLVGFEPGVVRVENALSTAAAPAVTPPPPPAMEAPASTATP